jgi:hypothetical protein
MTDPALWLDGNAIGGLLNELFGVELTGMPRGCQSCCARNPVGAHRLYRGAGLVLRCPTCGDVALRVVAVHDRHIMHLEGSWRIDVREPGREIRRKPPRSVATAAHWLTSAPTIYLGRRCVGV